MHVEQQHEVHLQQENTLPQKEDAKKCDEDNFTSNSNMCTASSITCVGPSKSLVHRQKIK